jgi:hypothetical protein
MFYFLGVGAVCVVKSPHPAFGHLLPREEAREKVMNASTEPYDYRLLPFAPSQMGEGARQGG